MSTLDGETDGETDGEMFRNLGFIADVSLVWWVYTLFFFDPPDVLWRQDDLQVKTWILMEFSKPTW